MDKSVWLVQRGDKILCACSTKESANKYIFDMADRENLEFIDEVIEPNCIFYIFCSIVSLMPSDSLITIFQVPFNE